MTEPLADEMLRPSEVAKAFGVDIETVTRWAKTGKLASVRTLGGHRRYRASQIRALLEAHQDPQRHSGPSGDRP